MTGLKYASQLFAVAGLAWAFGIFGDLDTGRGFAAPMQLTSLQGSVGSLFGQAPQRTDQSTRGGAGFGAATESNIQPVVRRAATCTLTQALLNTGREHLTRVNFDVAFLDASGRAIGEAVSVAVATDLPAGSERNVDLQLACPSTSEGAKISLAWSGADEASPPAIRLLARVSAPQTGPAQVAVPVEPELCPAPQQCDLPVTIEGGGPATFRFHRDEESPGLLVSDDPILAAHLLGHRSAVLDLGDTQAADITLTHLNVRQIDQPGILERWIAKLL